MLGSSWERVLESVRTFIRVRDAPRRGRPQPMQRYLPDDLHGGQLPGTSRRGPAGCGVGVWDRVKGHHLWVHFSQLAGAVASTETPRQSRVGTGWWMKPTWLRMNAACPMGAASCWTMSSGSIPMMGMTSPPAPSVPSWEKRHGVASDGRFNPCCAPRRPCAVPWGGLRQRQWDEPLRDLGRVRVPAPAGKPHGALPVPGVQHEKAGELVTAGWRELRVSPRWHPSRCLGEPGLRIPVPGSAEVSMRRGWPRCWTTRELTTSLLTAVPPIGSGTGAPSGSTRAGPRSTPRKSGFHILPDGNSLYPERYALVRQLPGRTLPCAGAAQAVTSISRRKELRPTTRGTATPAISGTEWRLSSGMTGGIPTSTGMAT